MIIPRWISFGVVMVVIGCSSSPTNRPATVPVRVRVVYKNEPVVGAAVTFINTEAQRSAYGTTGADGWVSLMTFKPADGAVPGPQEISVRKVEVIDKTKEGVDYSTTSNVPPPPEERWHLPKKYADTKTSGLIATVSAGDPNQIELELKD